MLLPGRAACVKSVHKDANMFHVGTHRRSVVVSQTRSWPYVRAESVPDILGRYISCSRRDEDCFDVIFMCALDEFDSDLMATTLKGCSVRITTPFTDLSAKMVQHAKFISIGQRRKDEMYYPEMRDPGLMRDFGCVPPNWAFSGELSICHSIVLPKRLDDGFKNVTKLSIATTKTNRQLVAGLPIGLKGLVVTGYPHVHSAGSSLMGLKNLSSLTLHCPAKLKITEYFPEIPTLTAVDVECRDVALVGVRSLLKHATSIRLMVNEEYSPDVHKTMLDQVTLCSRLTLLDTNLPFSMRFLKLGADKVVIRSQFMLGPSEVPELRVTRRIIPTWIADVTDSLIVGYERGVIDALFINNIFPKMTHSEHHHWLQSARGKLLDVQKVYPPALMRRLCSEMTQRGVHLPAEIMRMILAKVEEEFATTDFGILKKTGVTFVPKDCDMTSFWTHS
jgi:hypothetical protein